MSHFYPIICDHSPSAGIKISLRYLLFNCINVQYNCFLISRHYMLVTQILIYVYVRNIYNYGVVKIWLNISELMFQMSCINPLKTEFLHKFI
jgi:hypothetical protein